MEREKAVLFPAPFPLGTCSPASSDVWSHQTTSKSLKMLCIFMILAPTLAVPSCGTFSPSHPVSQGTQLREPFFLHPWSPQLTAWMTLWATAWY